MKSNGLISANAMYVTAGGVSITTGNMNVLSGGLIKSGAGNIVVSAGALSVLSSTAAQGAMDVYATTSGFTSNAVSLRVTASGPGNFITVLSTGAPNFVVRGYLCCGMPQMGTCNLWLPLPPQLGTNGRMTVVAGGLTATNNGVTVVAGGLLVSGGLSAGNGVVTAGSMSIISSSTTTAGLDVTTTQTGSFGNLIVGRVAATGSNALVLLEGPNQLLRVRRCWAL